MGMLCVFFEGVCGVCVLVCCCVVCVGVWGGCVGCVWWVGVGCVVCVCCVCVCVVCVCVFCVSFGGCAGSGGVWSVDGAYSFRALRKSIVLLSSRIAFTVYHYHLLSLLPILHFCR